MAVITVTARGRYIGQAPPGSSPVLLIGADGLAGQDHIQPHFASKTVAEIKEARVRSWRKKLLDSGVSTVTTAKAYRLLKAILNTAVDDASSAVTPAGSRALGKRHRPSGRS